MRTVLAAAAVAAAVGIAACGSGAGPAASGSSPVTAVGDHGETGRSGAGQGASSGEDAAPTVDWGQVRDYFAPEFRQTCTGLAGTELGRCVQSLARRSHALLGMIDGLPETGVVQELEKNAHEIVEQSEAFQTQACRSADGGGCGDAAGTVSADAEAISAALQEAAGGA